jgi:ATP-dependent helicase STH1/SNF2
LYETCHAANVHIQALEEGEDLEELSERARAIKERRAAKLIKEVESRNSPVFDEDTPRGRKAKKGKFKAVDTLYDVTPSSSKRKRGKAASITPSLNEDDEDDRDAVSRVFVLILLYSCTDVFKRNAARQRLLT